MTHLSAGDMLRAERAKAETSAVGKLIDGHIRNGTIVPVEITCGLLDDAMTAAANPNGYLVDGFPRNENNLQVCPLPFSSELRRRWQRSLRAGRRRWAPRWTSPSSSSSSARSTFASPGSLRLGCFSS